MQPLLWVLFIASAVILFYWKSIVRFVKQRKQLIDYVDRIPGPSAIPILGCSYQFKWDIVGII
jgi:hypothetical protein